MQLDVTLSSSGTTHSQPITDRSLNLRRWLSNVLMATTIFLILLGALVTSNNAGLSVPDWPTSYGQNMFLFPPSKWIGGIAFEHTHRLLASLVGLMTLSLTFWILAREERSTVRALSLLALGVVILQGILGGMTVLYQLPLILSASHGLLAQTFLLITAALAYSYSTNYHFSPSFLEKDQARIVRQLALVALAFLYSQLLFGALMRHSEAGLAVPDFPTMAGAFIPSTSSETVNKINEMRSTRGLPAVTALQVTLHLIHRLWAMIVGVALLYCGHRIFYLAQGSKILRGLAVMMAAGVLAQILLGISVVLLERQAIITSLHVVLGALLLLCSFCILLKSAPRNCFGLIATASP